jgi:hypothetical protein
MKTTIKKNQKSNHNFVRKIVAILILSIILFSCSKDDKSSASSASIIGKWEYQKADTRDGQSIISTNSFDPLPTCVRNYINIKADNKIDLVDHSSPCVAQTQSFSYTVSNSVLSYSSTNRTIEKLTTTDLILTEQTGPYITAYYFKKIQ